MREASHPWPVLAERCFQALDRDRVRFKDPTGRCAVASAGAAAMGLGLCVLAFPELVVGTVIVMGAVVVAVAIKEALDEYDVPAPEPKVAPRESSTNRQPRPDPAGQDVFPPVPADPWVRERRPECRPQRVPHLGGNELHNRCADRVPQNSFPGWDVLINGKHFDALQGATRTLWEVKTNAIETYNPYVRRTELQKQVEEGRRERDLAALCGYDFVIGVRTEIHKQMFKDAAPDLKVVLMTWC